MSDSFPVLDATHTGLRDWPEDREHENGSYLCRCVHCKETFVGYKRRVVCRVCHDRDAQQWQERGQWLAQLERLGCRHDHPVGGRVVQTGAYADLLLRYHVETKLRGDLIEAFNRLAKAAANVPGAHYAIKDGMEIVAEAKAMDTPCS